MICSQFPPVTLPSSPHPPLFAHFCCVSKQTWLWLKFVLICQFCVPPPFLLLRAWGKPDELGEGGALAIQEMWILQALVLTGHVSPKVWPKNLRDYTCKESNSSGSSVLGVGRGLCPISHFPPHEALAREVEGSCCHFWGSKSFASKVVLNFPPFCYFFLSLSISQCPGQVLPPPGSLSWLLLPEAIASSKTRSIYHLSSPVDASNIWFYCFKNFFRHK